MYLLLLQLLVFLPQGKAVWQRGDPQRKSSASLLHPDRNRRELSRDHQEEAQEKPDLFVSMPHLIGVGAVGDSQRQREKMLSRFGRIWKKPERTLPPTQDSSEHPSPFLPVPQELPQSKEAMHMEKIFLQEEAKKFWHHFMFRMSPASQGVILPIKSHEVHQETCRTVPFSQTITHEECEKVTVQNNLCFGKCVPVQSPGTTQHQQTFCSHCLPTKFTTMHLQLNCTDLAPVVKLVMLVEECQCKVKAEHAHGHLLQDGFQAQVHAQEPFIPGVST